MRCNEAIYHPFAPSLIQIHMQQTSSTVTHAIADHCYRDVRAAGGRSVILDSRTQNPKPCLLRPKFGQDAAQGRRHSTLPARARMRGRAVRSLTVSRLRSPAGVLIPFLPGGRGDRRGPQDPLGNRRSRHVAALVLPRRKETPSCIFDRDERIGLAFHGHALLGVDGALRRAALLLQEKRRRRLQARCTHYGAIDARASHAQRCGRIRYGR